MQLFLFVIDKRVVIHVNSVRFEMTALARVFQETNGSLPRAVDILQLRIVVRSWSQLTWCPVPQLFDIAGYSSLVAVKHSATKTTKRFFDCYLPNAPTVDKPVWWVLSGNLNGVETRNRKFYPCVLILHSIQRVTSNWRIQEHLSAKNNSQ